MDFRTFVRHHRSYVTAFAIIIVVLLAIDGWLVYKRVRYTDEISRLRAGMTDFERRRTDALLADEDRRLQMMIELIRRQARWDKEIHLSVSVDSARMFLEREGALLREFAVDVGPERRVGAPPDTVHLVAPIGTRSVERVLQGDYDWEVPKWVYLDRALPVPEERTVGRALGPIAILLEGGTVIYSPPTAGPLEDSSYVLPGAIRASEEDLRAVVPNLRRGTSVYFF
ncbi:MAG TPA: hypothetical protein VJ596_01890 [Gemmatimonadaceae bacterium]|nr:hypothetical protein [Gemmatimonadaceae bacterium]